MSPVGSGVCALFWDFCSFSLGRRIGCASSSKFCFFPASCCPLRCKRNAGGEARDVFVRVSCVCVYLFVLVFVCVFVCLCGCVKLFAESIHLDSSAREKLPISFSETLAPGPDASVYMFVLM